MKANSPIHQPVLLREMAQYLDLHNGQVVVDGTLGMGGAASLIADQIAPQGVLIGIDRDRESMVIAEENLKDKPVKKVFIHTDFQKMPAALAEAGYPQVDRIFLDLGISSFQLDNAERGFSFDNDGNLDMRMDRSQGITAADIVNHWEETEIANLIYQYGEERLSRRIARKIVECRKEQTIETTEQLRGIIELAVAGTGYRSRNRIHPATRSFQALRLRVNTELESLKVVLDEYLNLLKPGGRIGIISFHSLEDRLVKTAFKKDAGECVCGRELQLCTCTRQPRIRILTKKPLTPQEDEVHRNPRSRSGKFRVAEKL